VKTCPVCAREYPDEIRFCSDDGTTLRSAAPAASLVGQVIADRYHVVKKLGEGGMGQVYLAEHVKMGRRSAIKVMSPSMVHDPEAVARFNREAQNASRITHPNVCAVYDFGETPDGLIYLAMEFVDGESLTGLLERDGALPLPRATAIFKQTADALQAAHDLGVVHRDLKPDNIMVARARDGSDVVKVVDFGIAKAFTGDEATAQKVTKTGLVVGTPEFMSPEQLSGDNPDGRSDLYSLALVYFRMLTGRLPFEADTVQEVMIKRLTDEPATLAEARPDLSFPAGLQEVLDTALARTPGERYASVAKFAEDVLGVVQLARTSRGVAPATRADVEQKTQLVDSHETRVRATARTAKSKRSLVPLVVGAAVVVGLGGGAWAVFGHGGAAAPGDSTQLQAADTSHRQADTAKLAAAPAGSTKTVPPLRNPSGPRTVVGDSVTPLIKPMGAIDPGQAFDAIDDMMMKKLTPASARWIRDSAMKFYDAPSVTKADKAYAAFLVANAYWNMNQRAEGCNWVRTAINLDPASTAYSGALAQCPD
jgi:eukaryotic-like serine/threonine-protein kinase